MKKLLFLLLLTSLSAIINAQTLTSGNGESFTPRGSSGKTGARDTTAQKQIPRGMTVWTVDELTGATQKAVPDTTSYLRMNHVYASGVYGEYNTLGNNGTPRYNRIFTDRNQPYDFLFANVQTQMLVAPGDFHFTNTLSPITNLAYNECGNKVNGEDRLKAMFAVNANKRLGFGFKFDYLYARGYYANQNNSHLNTSVWTSYSGDRYQLHFLFSTNHQKQAENGGIENDDYIVHPELFSQNFAENEIPTILEQNWNINDNHHFFLTQRYSFGFHRRVPMTEQEKQAKQFALNAEKERENQDTNSPRLKKGEKPVPVPTGRPESAKIAGDEPAKEPEDRSDRIAVTAEEANDSAAVEMKNKENDQFMKNEYVPVTSFFHTAKIDLFRRVFRAYATPENYYANDYYQFANDSIEDRNRHTYIRNNLGVSLLEGFNKWAKAGINLFAGHEMRHFSLPKIDGTYDSFNESSFIIGGEIVKHEGKTLHFNARGEYYLLGTDAEQLFIDGNLDLNFPLFGDTIRLDANAKYHLYVPDTYFCKYASRHFMWDNDFDKESLLHIEGNLSLSRTETRLRFAFDNISNYTYFGTSYNTTSDNNHTYITGITVTPRQASSIQIVTAQLYQNLHYGILHWDNILTFQKILNTPEMHALSLPQFNVYSNLYLRFKIAKVLDTDFGADLRYFTKYDAPEYNPALQSFVVQENDEIRTQIGNYPIINAYFNFNLKNCRFYVMMSHVNCSGKGNYFLTPHHPINSRVFRIGVNWNFFN